MLLRMAARTRGGWMPSATAAALQLKYIMMVLLASPASVAAGYDVPTIEGAMRSLMTGKVGILVFEYHAVGAHGFGWRAA